jgi:hypothetical protein
MGSIPLFSDKYLQLACYNKKATISQSLAAFKAGCDVIKWL